MGPTFTIDVSSPPAYDRDEENENNFRSRSEIPQSNQSPTVSSESSSSIGSPGEDTESDDDNDDNDDNDDDVVSSKLGFDSLVSLDDSLPTKRGLSNNYSGKSKSFGNLSEVKTVKDLEKTENPINKKRRVLIACKWSRKSSFYNWCASPKSMPLLALKEEEEEERQEEHESSSSSFDSFQEKQQKQNFKAARSCFDLAHLQQHQ